MSLNRLFYGDNLEVLRERIPDESVDLIYLDPPFNSNRNYNVIFSRRDVLDDANRAQIQAFDDTWRWSPETDLQYRDAMAGGLPARVAEALAAMHTLLGENDAMAYLTNMAPRLVELHRVLRRTGSLYLHCDPTMSHYLKVLLDTVFGPEHFRNEIAWLRSGAKNDSLRLGRSHDTILFYTKSKSFTWHTQYEPFRDASTLKNYTHVEEGTGRRYRRGDLTAAKAGGDVDFEWQGARPYKGRHWAYSRENLDRMFAEGRIELRRTGMPTYKRYLDEQPGVPLQDVWTDVRLTSSDKERLGYPTQKPVALLSRIVACSSNPGDVVLDPFCGCGTAVDAAQRLDRRWIGIDITYIAVDLIEKRLRYTFGDAVAATYEVHGIPKDTSGALALFDRSPFEFERWAVSLLNATPNARQVGDKGIDGVIRFHVKQGQYGKALVSVKGGRHIGPQYVRDLLGTVQTQEAEMGVLTTMKRPTRGMMDAADHAGNYTWPVNGQVFPKIQLATVPDLLTGRRLSMPPSVNPYISAVRHLPVSDQLSF